MRERPRCLVVDDEPQIRRAVRHLLEGLEPAHDASVTGDTPAVLEAATAREALTIAAAERTRFERAAEHIEVRREADQMLDAVQASVSRGLRTPLKTFKVPAHELRSVGDERSDPRGGSRPTRHDAARNVAASSLGRRGGN